MQDLVRKRTFWVFYLLAISLPVILWTYAIVMELRAAQAGLPSTTKEFYATQAAVREANPVLTAHKDSVITSVLSYQAYPLAWPFLFFPFAPTVMALLTVWLGWGGKGITTLLGALKPIRGSLSVREGAMIYLALLGLIALAGVVLASGAFLSGGEDMRKQLFAELGLAGWQTFVAVVLTSLLLNQGALLEELGWRGFAWPLLVRRLGAPLLAAVLLGIAWALWHLPREIPTILLGGLDLQNLVLGQAIFIGTCVSMTIVAVYFVNITGGSVWPVIMIHGALNLFYVMTTLKMDGARSDLVNPSVLVWIAAAVITLLVVGPDLGWKRRQELHKDGDPSDLWAQGRA